MRYTFPMPPAPKRHVLLALLVLGLAGTEAHAQGPDAPWRTLETAHYRVHYPAPAEPWARSAAERLEAIRERVVAEVGYAPTETTDVLVSDPISRANGSAWPILGWPRMVLWTTPPGPDSVIGFYRDWRDILLIHEDTHLVHMLRPSRNPLRRRLARVSPTSPVMTRSPRWLLEGYATLLEGRLTGSGRPQSDLRATILRRWAQLGELPSYGRLNGGAESWRGLSMAYLVGSAYLEWLVERTGPDALRDLWARLSARRNRTFDEAFAGVFGDSPARLYNRFRAELTYRAMTLERLLEPELVEGESWQELSWTTGAPAVSPDGEHLVLVLRSRQGPSRLVVWSTGTPEKEEGRWQERRKKLIERDPDDVPAVRGGPLPRDPVAELTTRDGAEPHDPRWIAGAGTDHEMSLLFWRDEPDGDGFLRPDLFRWFPEPEGRGRVERLTRGASVREADPMPGGGWAVAVRQRWGASQLVAVALAGGEVRPLDEPSIETVYHHPRIAPDGRRLAVVAHREGGWRLELWQLEPKADGPRLAGGPWAVALPADTMIAHPAWSDDGETVYAAVGEGGLIDIRAFDVQALESGSDNAAQRRITTSLGAALAPAPTPDGRALFYLGLEADGLDVRRLELSQVGRQDSEAPPRTIAERLADLAGTRGLSVAELAPVLRPPAPEPPSPPEPREVGDDRAYGMGRLELLPLVGGAWGPSGGRWELGARAGDLVGRLDLLALYGTGDAFDGGALAGTWRGWPVEVGFHLFELDTGDLVVGEERGIELSARWDRRSRRGLLVARAGAYAGETDAPGGSTAPAFERKWLYFAPGFSHARELGGLRLSASLGLRFETGETEARDGAVESWQRWGGALRLGVALRDGPGLSLRWRARDSSGFLHPVDQFELGGLDSSLWPEALRGQRLFVPALPPRTLSGERAESWRLALHHASWPIELFAERHRLANAGTWSPWLDLWGVELRLSRAPLPLLRLPAFELRLGIAELLDGVDSDAEGMTIRDGDLEAWLALTWRP